MDFNWSPRSLKTRDGKSIELRHIWCIGRNYAAHAREMGSNPETESPLFFSKPAACMVQSERIEYPAQTELLHYEAELAVFLGAGGRYLGREQAQGCIAGWAAACDLTRRDLQSKAKQAGHPWEMSKGFDQSAPVGRITSVSDWQPDPDTTIELTVNGELCQQARLGEMIWDVPALLSRLSDQVTLHAGDVVLTGTPSGVGEIVRQDEVRISIQGLDDLCFALV